MFSNMHDEPEQLRDISLCFHVFLPHRNKNM